MTESSSDDKRPSSKIDAAGVDTRFMRKTDEAGDLPISAARILPYQVFSLLTKNSSMQSWSSDVLPSNFSSLVSKICVNSLLGSVKKGLTFCWWRVRS